MKDLSLLEPFLLEHVAGRSLALVGNGAIACPQGSVIDSHDFVMRFNNLNSLLANDNSGRRFTHWINNRDDYRQPPVVETGIRHNVPVLLTVNGSRDSKANNACQFYLDHGFTVFHPERDVKTNLCDARERTGFTMATLLARLNIECNVFGFTPLGGTRGKHNPAVEHDLLLAIPEVVVVPTAVSPGEADWPTLKFGIAQTA